MYKAMRKNGSTVYFNAQSMMQAWRYILIHEKESGIEKIVNTENKEKMTIVEFLIKM